MEAEARETPAVLARLVSENTPALQELGDRCGLILLALPPATRLFHCHDYPAAGQAPQLSSTVAEQRAANIHLHDGVDESDFVAMRRQRDATLAMPTLLLPSVQVNMRAGHLPPAEDNGIRYLKIPLDRL